MITYNKPIQRRGERSRVSCLKDISTGSALRQFLPGNELQTIINNCSPSPQAVQLQHMADNYAFRQPSPKQKAERTYNDEMITGNSTKLFPPQKTGFFRETGPSIDPATHFNPSGPEETGARSYALGNDLCVKPDQERHLPHEVSPVIKHFQGKVVPAMSLKGLNTNDDRAANQLRGQASGLFCRTDALKDRQRYPEKKTAPGLRCLSRGCLVWKWS